MKQCLFLLALAFSFNTMAQSMCGTANEGELVTLTAPAGMVFTTVTFASYGTPNGSCGGFTLGACHAANSQTIVEAALIGNNSATIAASNGVFGDPCGGTVKRLYIEATYSSSLPLRLISFSCTSNNTANLLQWQTTAETNTQGFDIERSVDGLSFATIGSITSRNSSGTNLYAYTDNSLWQQTYFYRLKMIDQDGSFTYSRVIKTQTALTSKLNVFPNPVTNDVSISGLNATGFIEVTTLLGERLQRLHITGSTQTVSMAGYAAGMYILKYTTGNNTFYQKIIKQ
ncbi:MAG: T9SS type A sorting domain-containing protein [Flavisolibacter sp.]